MGISEIEALAFMFTGGILIVGFKEVLAADKGSLFTFPALFFVLGCFLLAFGIADVAVDHL